MNSEEFASKAPCEVVPIIMNNAKAGWPGTPHLSASFYKITANTKGFTKYRQLEGDSSTSMFSLKNFCASIGKNDAGCKTVGIGICSESFGVILRLLNRTKN